MVRIPPDCASLLEVQRGGGNSNTILFLGNQNVKFRRHLSYRRIPPVFCLLKQFSVKRCVAILLILSLLSILYYTHYLSSPLAR